MKIYIALLILTFSVSSFSQEEVGIVVVQNEILDSLIFNLFGENDLCDIGNDTLYLNATRTSIGEGVHIRMRQSKNEINMADPYNQHCDSVITKLELEIGKFLSVSNFNKIILINAHNNFIIVSCQKKILRDNQIITYFPNNFIWEFNEHNYNSDMFKGLIEFKEKRNHVGTYQKGSTTYKSINCLDKSSDFILIAE